VVAVVALALGAASAAVTPDGRAVPGRVATSSAVAVAVYRVVPRATTTPPSLDDLADDVDAAAADLTAALEQARSALATTPPGDARTALQAAVDAATAELAVPIRFVSRTDVQARVDAQVATTQQLGAAVRAASDAAAAAAAAAAETFVPAAPGPQTDASPDEYARALVVRTNDERTSRGLPALAEAVCAAPVALARAAALTGRDLAHASLSEVTGACAGARTSGENLARGAVAPSDVLAAWMASPGHRANILDTDYTAMAVACVHDGDEMLCSQVFTGP
jgi:uncharacterized protein YkwD